MKFLKSFQKFENQEIRNSEEILTIAGKKINISKLTKQQQQDIFNLIGQFDTQMSEDELLETVELYIMSLS